AERQVRTLHPAPDGGVSEQDSAAQLDLAITAVPAGGATVLARAVHVHHHTGEPLPDPSAHHDRLEQVHAGTLVGGRSLTGPLHDAGQVIQRLTYPLRHVLTGGVRQADLQPVSVHQAADRKSTRLNSSHVSISY